MRIAQLMPGSGGAFYCENCLRDAVLVRALIRGGHDVTMLPMYLPPVGADVEDLPGGERIFFGGVNVYLQQKSSIFRKSPRWLDRLFDNRGFLRWAGGKASMTSTKGLGEMTVSMLEGERGRQVKELRRLVEWFSQDANRADVVVLSNVLLAGLAGALKRELGVVVVCLLQDEDGFVDSFDGGYSDQAWERIAKCCGDIDAFVSVSRYYGDVMRQRCGFDASRLHVISPGLEVSKYSVSEAVPEVPTIGFLSQMCEAKGLDVLADAFAALKSEDGLGDIRLRICGGKSASDDGFVDSVREKLSSARVLDDVEFVEGFELSKRVKFLQGISVVSVPEKHGSAYGLYAIEANVVGVPFVEPDIGVFGELAEATGGGVVYSSNTVEALTGALRKFLVDGEYARRVGMKGREGVLEKFDVDRNACKMVEVFEGLLESE